MNKFIKERRKELNLTLEEIGEYVGVSKATVQRWETGSIANMRQDRIKKLSEILQVDSAVLIGQEEKPEHIRIPVLGNVAAGKPASAVEDILDWEEIPARWAENSQVFALRINGDSMEPRMTKGDVVIVRSQGDVESGKTAIVLIADQDATCKKIIKHENGIMLVSNNTKYPPMFYSKEDIEKLPVIILGQVIELRAKF